MVNIIYWSLLPKIGTFVSKRSQQCLNIGADIVVGVCEFVGMELYTKAKASLNEAMNLKGAAYSCSEKLPIKLTEGYEKVEKIMKTGGKDAISQAKAVMKENGVDKKCIEIFALVCKINALEIVKEACANL